MIDQLFSVRVRCPGYRERREMLRRVRTRIAAGLDDDIGQAKDRRPYGQGGKRAAGKLRSEELKNDVSERRNR